MTCWYRLLLAVLLPLSLVSVGAAQEAQLQPITIAQAVRGDWQSMVPPTEGWESISVRDSWNQRWPAFDGVVWYRMEWDQASPQATGLLLDYVNMAGAIYVNEILLDRDRSLVEPLTRSWNRPRFFVLEPPLLREGRNVLLIRVSGLAAYAPGIGTVFTGPVAAVRQAYQRRLFLHQESPRFALAIEATLGAFFIMLWLFRRSEIAFGWYGLSTLVWLAYQFNFIATSPWPFIDTHTWQVVNACSAALFSTTYTMFVLRFCERRFARAERALWLVLALGVLVLLSLPYGPRDYGRGMMIFAAGMLLIAANILLIVLAWRGKAVEPRVMSVVAALYIAAAAHDLAVFERLIASTDFYGDITAFANTLSIAAVLAFRYTRNLQRIQSFNLKLQHDVEAARGELAGTLRREHDMQMIQARIGERLNLVRDIHDGLGSSLLGSIAAIEHSPQTVSVPYLLKILKELRDELRLIVDMSLHGTQDNASFADQLVPLRHRMTRLLDASNIDCRWTLSGIDALYLASAQVLDAQRFLQEALTNVLKHSAASRVDVNVVYAAGLQIEVIDNGLGMTDARGTGAGLASMQMRANRLGGRMLTESIPGRTRVAICDALR